MADVYERFPRLKERKRQLAGTLSGGEQQMLAVGRALMGKPKLILMDEPSMGLSPLLVKEIFAIIREVNKQGITILLVEQNAKMALAISDRAYVLETGTITLSGDAQELLNDARVKKSLFGAVRRKCYVSELSLLCRGHYPHLRVGRRQLHRQKSWRRILILICMTANCCAWQPRTAASMKKIFAAADENTKKNAAIPCFAAYLRRQRHPAGERQFHQRPEPFQLSGQRSCGSC